MRIVFLWATFLLRFSIVGDFNVENPIWNPPGDIRCDGESEAFLEFQSEKQLNILNDGQVTTISPNEQRESAIDLGLVSAELQPCRDFNVIDDWFGSDHFPLTLYSVDTYSDASTTDRF